MFDVRGSSIAFLFIFLLIFANMPSAAGMVTRGGNITAVNLANATGPSTWFGFFGMVSPSSFLPLSIIANRGNITYATVNTGSAACVNGTQRLNLLFSTAPAILHPLHAGNISQLDAFIGPYSNSANATFLSAHDYQVSTYTVSGVPSTETFSTSWQTFRMGYMQDLAGNFVFITNALNPHQSFNGSNVDFQIMLPTNNGANTTYYMLVDLECVPNVPPQPPTSSTGGGAVGGGNGSLREANYTFIYPVSAGGSRFCPVLVERHMKSSASKTYIETVLTNIGGQGCTLSGFTYAEKIPTKIPNILDIITYSPDFDEMIGDVGVYRFGKFAPGEKLYFEYSLPGFHSASHLWEFISFAMFTDKPNDAIQQLIPDPLQPPIKCNPDIACNDWSSCDSLGLRSRSCIDMAGCVPDIHWTERCPFYNDQSGEVCMSGLEYELCKFLPFICDGERVNWAYVYICPLLIILLLALILAMLMLRRIKKAREDGELDRINERGKELYSSAVTAWRDHDKEIAEKKKEAQDAEIEKVKKRAETMGWSIYSKPKNAAPAEESPPAEETAKSEESAETGDAQTGNEPAAAPPQKQEEAEPEESYEPHPEEEAQLEFSGDEGAARKNKGAAASDSASEDENQGGRSDDGASASGQSGAEPEPTEESEPQDIQGASEQGGAGSENASEESAPSGEGAEAIGVDSDFASLKRKYFSRTSLHSDKRARAKAKYDESIPGKAEDSGLIVSGESANDAPPENPAPSRVAREANPTDLKRKYYSYTALHADKKARQKAKYDDSVPGEAEDSGLIVSDKPSSRKKNGPKDSDG